MIDPSAIAFDIDGVVADTMSLFLDIAYDEFNISGIRYEDITCYILAECIDMDPEVIDTIIVKLLNGDYKAVLKPIKGAPEVLTRLGHLHKPVLFVTARPYPGPIPEWIQKVIPLGQNEVEIITTGTFEAKTDVLLEKGIRYFVEDRLDTCFRLKDAGITPIVFKQPWNRESHPFIEVENWKELELMIRF